MTEITELIPLEAVNNTMSIATAQSYLTNELRGESVNIGNWLVYVNQAFGLIAADSRPGSKTWHGAELTQSGMQIAVPVDCLEIVAIEYRGSPLIRVTRQVANAMDPCGSSGNGIGEPSWWFREGNVLYFNVTASPLEELHIIGFRRFPQYTELVDDTAENPFDLLPTEFLYTPLEYVLGMIPPGTLGNGQLDPRGAARQQRFFQLAQMHIKQCQEALYFKDLEDYTP